MTIAYTTDGKPLTKKEYDLRLQKAEKQIVDGNVYSQDELEELSNDW